MVELRVEFQGAHRTGQAGLAGRPLRPRPRRNRIHLAGDIIQARDRAAESGNGVNVAYSIPKEGAPQWFDMLAIPKDAKNVDSAYAFINYLLDPKVAAANTNFVTYPNPGRIRCGNACSA